MPRHKLPRYVYRQRYKVRGGYVRTLYYVRFTDWKGKKRVFPAGDSPEAVKEIRDGILKKNYAQYDFDRPERADVTFAQWADYCLGLVRDKKSFPRICQHAEHLKGFFGPLLLSEITKTKILEYRALRLTAPIIRHGKPARGIVKLSTVNRELAALRWMLNLAAEEGLIEAVPKIKLDSERHLRRERTLNEKEWGALLDNSPVWFRKILIAARSTAMDRGDLVRLTWPKVDWQVGVIRLEGGRGKTGVRVVVPILPDLEEVLKEILAEGRVSNIKGLVFTDEGKAVGKAKLRWALGKAMKVADIENFRFKDIRHMAKSRWSAMNIPPEASMLAAGQRTLAAHEIYVHWPEETLRRVFLEAWKNYTSP